MLLTESEQEIFDFVSNSVPDGYSKTERGMEDILLIVKVFDRIMTRNEFLFSQSMILNSTFDGETDWANEHARDRGTTRQAGESTESLIQRITSPNDAVTLGSIRRAAQAILDASSILGPVGIVQLRSNRSFFGKPQSQTGTGGEFFSVGSGFGFVPSEGHAPPLRMGEQDRDYTATRLFFAGSASAVNDGEKPLTGLSNNIMLFDGPGAAEVDPGVSWTIRKYNRDGRLMDGFNRTYLGRDYWIGSGMPVNTRIIILPFGCTPTTVEAVDEAVRLKEAGGFRHIVECRTSP